LRDLVEGERLLNHDTKFVLNSLNLMVDEFVTSVPESVAKPGATALKDVPLFRCQWLARGSVFVSGIVGALLMVSPGCKYFR
jgi:hypothetical protein